jgi:alkanesulfonate monooxygenase SsuD/methylene tetrahydromethanopterin reductase-like flavin-dependent oxidoreductase (luciferase family)
MAPMEVISEYAPGIWLNLNMVPGSLLVDAARAAEDLGLTGVTMGDHFLAPPVGSVSTYPYLAGARDWGAKVGWLTPWVAFSAMTMAATRLRFCSGVTVAPLHDTLALAKIVASVDHLAPGRVVLGAGIGWLSEDYELVGRPFSDRGARLDLMIQQLRALWSVHPVPLGNGAVVDRRLTEPLPSRPIPILVGGHSQAALRRAGRADGWIGSNVELDDICSAVSVIRCGRRDRGPAATDAACHAVRRAGRRTSTSRGRVRSDGRQHSWSVVRRSRWAWRWTSRRWPRSSRGSDNGWGRANGAGDRGQALSPVPDQDTPRSCRPE